jgi:hypothetical protein
VARGDREKRLQKALLLWHQPEERSHVLEALRVCGREEAVSELLGGSRRIPKSRSGPKGGTRRP